MILGQGYKSLDEGDFVNFEIVDSGKGLKAQNVERQPTSQQT